MGIEVSTQMKRNARQREQGRYENIGGNVRIQGSAL